MNEVCHWGHVSHNRLKPCMALAVKSFKDSGLAYCLKHYEIVLRNREWLFRKLGAK